PPPGAPPLDAPTLGAPPLAPVPSPRLEESSPPGPAFSSGVPPAFEIAPPSSAPPLAVCPALSDTLAAPPDCAAWACAREPACLPAAAFVASAGAPLSLEQPAAKSSNPQTASNEVAIRRRILALEIDHVITANAPHDSGATRDPRA